MSETLNPLINLGISCFFILSLRGLTFPRSAYRSNLLGIIGMSLTLLWMLITCAHPFMVLSFLCLSVIPELRITDKGYVDISRGGSQKIFVR